MENGIGKTCPFCKTDIKEGDAVKVCPSCNTPHHESCWGENKGCAMLSCTVNDENNNLNSDGEKLNEVKKRKSIKIIIAAIAVLFIVIVAILIVPKIFVSVEDLCAQGKYEEAYKKADETEKHEIYAENAAAVLSGVTSDCLKDPNSFELRDVYYYEAIDDTNIKEHLVLFVTATNSFGARVSSYWLYSYYDFSGEYQEWSYSGNFSDLSEEVISEFDDAEEIGEKAVNNMWRTTIQESMVSGNKLSEDAVERINTLFETGELDNVELIDIESDY